MGIDNKRLYSFPRGHMSSCDQGVCETMASLTELIWWTPVSCDLYFKLVLHGIQYKAIVTIMLAGYVVSILYLLTEIHWTVIMPNVTVNMVWIIAC